MGGADGAFLVAPVHHFKGDAVLFLTGQGSGRFFRLIAYNLPCFQVKFRKSCFGAERVFIEVVNPGGVLFHGNDIGCVFSFGHRLPGFFPFQLVHQPVLGPAVKGRFFGSPETGLLDISFVQIIGNPGAAAGAPHGAFPLLHVQVK